jgi:hypothetical protein
MSGKQRNQFYFYLFPHGAGDQSRALHMLGRCSPTEPHPKPHFIYFSLCAAGVQA